MSFLKSLLLAIIAIFILSYVFGLFSFASHSFDNNAAALTHMHVVFNGEVLEPIKALGLSAVFVVLLFMLALVAVFSVFGGLFFIALFILGCVVMFTLSTFWPILMIAFAIWGISKLVFKDKSTDHYA